MTFIFKPPPTISGLKTVHYHGNYFLNPESGGCHGSVLYYKLHCMVNFRGPQEREEYIKICQQAQAFYEGMIDMFIAVLKMRDREPKKVKMIIPVCGFSFFLIKIKYYFHIHQDTCII